MIFTSERRGGLQYYDPQEQAWTPKILEMQPSRSGVSISEVTAMKCLAVYACIRCISEDVAKLPMHLYQKIDPRGKERVHNRTSHLLTKQPNPEMSAYDFKRTMQGHVLQWGNAFAEIVFDESMQPSSLWILPPDRIKVCRNKATGEVYYQFRPNYIDNAVDMPSWKMLHIKGLGFDGLVGYSPIRIAAEAIGVAMAQERFAASFFGNGAFPGVIIKHPMKLSEQAEKRLKYSWEQAFRGTDTSNRTAVLQEGMTLDKMTIAPEEAQFLESRQFSTEEIARLFRVPPHKIGHLERATFSNIEEQNREYATDCLHPHIISWEQECDRKLNLPDGQFFKHKFDELLRANAVARATFYTQMRMAGAFSSNDIRDEENMNPDLQGGGDTLFIQSAMIPLHVAAAATAADVKKPAGIGGGDNKVTDAPPDTVKQQTGAIAAGQGIKQKDGSQNMNTNTNGNASKLAQIAENHAVLLSEILTKSLKIEAERALKAAKKGGFEQWKQDFFAYISAQIRPSVRAIVNNFCVTAEMPGNPDEMTERFIARHCEESQTCLVPSTVESMVLGWNEARALREAKEFLGVEK